VICYSRAMSDRVPSDAEIADLYRDGRSFRAIAGLHPLLTFSRVRAIVMASGVPIRGNGGMRAVTNATRSA
jgi:hypothetical protein